MIFHSYLIPLIKLCQNFENSCRDTFFNNFIAAARQCGCWKITPNLFIVVFTLLKKKFDTRRQISWSTQVATFVLTGGGICWLLASTENPEVRSAMTQFALL